jgi:hypothetical protein
MLNYTFNVLMFKKMIKFSISDNVRTRTAFSFLLCGVFLLIIFLNYINFNFNEEKIFYKISYLFYPSSWKYIFFFFYDSAAWTIPLMFFLLSISFSTAYSIKKILFKSIGIINIPFFTSLIFAYTSYHPSKSFFTPGGSIGLFLNKLFFNHIKTYIFIWSILIFISIVQYDGLIIIKRKSLKFLNFINFFELLTYFKNIITSFIFFKIEILRKISKNKDNYLYEKLLQEKVSSDLKESERILESYLEKNKNKPILKMIPTIKDTETQIENKYYFDNLHEKIIEISKRMKVDLNFISINSSGEIISLLFLIEKITDLITLQKNENIFEKSINRSGFRIIFEIENKKNLIAFEYEAIEKNKCNFFDNLTILNKDQKENEIPFIIGKNSFGKITKYNFSEISNILLICENSSIKYNIINSIFTSFFLTNSYENFQISILSENYYEMFFYEEIPNLIFSISKDIYETIDKIYFFYEEIKKRKSLFDKKYANSLEQYNSISNETEKLKNIIIFIDELDLILEKNVGIEKYIIQMISLSKNIGIFFIFSISKTKNYENLNILFDLQILNKNIYLNNNNYSISEKIVSNNDAFIIYKNKTLERINIFNITIPEITNIFSYIKEKKKKELIQY